MRTTDALSGHAELRRIVGFIAREESLNKRNLFDFEGAFSGKKTIDTVGAP
jgi:hypothetical protein